MAPHSHDRILALVNRLTARNRFAWAAKIYEDWLNDCRKDAEGICHPMPLNLWRLGRLLREAGDNASAARIFGELAMILAKPGSGPMYLLHRSFDEWARCLEACGSHKSAVETRALGRKLAAQQKRVEHENGDYLRALSPSRLIRPTVSRCTFLLSLDWDFPGDSFVPKIEDGYFTLRERFRLSEPETCWLEFEAKAPAEPDPRYPHVAVGVKFPWCFLESQSRLEVLGVVNDMNLDNSATSSCLELDTGKISVRTRVAFAGFNETTGPSGDIAAAQEEVTINKMLEVFGMASGWFQLLADLNLKMNKDHPR